MSDIQLNSNNNKNKIENIIFILVSFNDHYQYSN